jgi:hypothetical protein
MKAVTISFYIINLKSFLLKRSFHSVDEFLPFLLLSVWVYPCFYETIKNFFHLTYIILGTEILLIIEYLNVGPCIIFYS